MSRTAGIVECVLILVGGGWCCSSTNVLLTDRCAATVVCSVYLSESDEGQSSREEPEQYFVESVYLDDRVVLLMAWGEEGDIYLRKS